MQWNNEKTQLVQELWPTHSATMIACKISQQFRETCTRNSAMGIAYRLGLCSKRMKGGPGHLPEFNIREGKPRPRMSKPKPATPGFAPRPDGHRNGEPGIQCPCQVVDLESYNCRWPIGDPQLPGFYFCGAIAAEDSPYCPSHHEKAYVPDKRMRDAA